MTIEIDLEKIHKNCFKNEDTIRESRLVGCFSCITIFPPSEIEVWIDESENTLHDEKRTATCPKCCVDSLLPESDDYIITKKLLKKMNKYWFKID